MRKLLLLLSVLVGTLLLSACGSDEDRSATVRSTTIAQIIGDAGSWVQGPAVTVRGRAYPREGGFLLVESGSSIWVAAPSGVEDLERGERVTIRGEVKRLTRDDDDEVIEALRRPVEPGLPPPEADAVEKTPAEVGDPFIVFRALLSGGDERRAGEAGTQTSAATGEGGDIYNVAEVRRRLEAAGLMLVRTGGGAGLAEEVDEPLLAAHRYEVAPSSREFELLIFASRPLLQRGLEDLRRPDRLLDEEYEFASGANALAAFPPPTDDFRGFAIVRRVLSELE